MTKDEIKYMVKIKTNTLTEDEIRYMVKLKTNTITKDEIKDMVKAFLLSVVIISAFICASAPQLFRDILSYIF